MIAMAFGYSEKNRIDLEGLEPAETGLLVDGEIGAGEVYGTFADLLVKGYVAAVGAGNERAYNRIEAKTGLNEFESVIMESVFPSNGPVKHRELVSSLGNADLETFTSGVVIGAIRKGLYDLPPKTVLAVVFQYHMFNKKIRPLAQILMALSFFLPLYELLFFSTFFSFFLVIFYPGIGPILTSLIYVLFAFFPLVGIGMLSGFALLLWLNINAKRIDRNFVLPMDVLLVGLGTFFVLGHAGFAMMLYRHMKKTNSELNNFDKYLTEKGKKHKQRYLELRSFLQSYPLSESRLSNEFEAFAISFDLRPEGTIPS